MVVDRLLSRLEFGRVELTFWDGETRRYGRGGPEAHLRLTDPAVVRRALRSASLAVGEAYVDGDIQIPEDDLDTLFWILASNRARFRALRPLRLLHRTEPNRRSTQRGQISRHYDVGNAYYRLFLDDTLSYFCAYFTSDDDTLETAQRQKIDHTLAKLRPLPGHRILDIGCGWGHLLVGAAKAHEVTGVGITLSSEQLAEARTLAEREGVADRVRFELMNFQDLATCSDPALRGPFDRVVSVGMFEHVGRRLHPVFFAAVRDLLVTHGIAVMNTITDQRDQQVDAWVDRYVFPGGHLPTVARIERLLAASGLWSVDRENLWRHYGRTVGLWRERHRAHRAEIVAMYDERFYRIRDLWLAGSKAGFDYGSLGLTQLVFTKGKPADWPWVRPDAG
ncbi:cyclopropane-fatty-acyl-phospholipid synthase family protein [Nocardioides terrisoli]|uniref:cyclopropane-fatty-acyl-phospholipid synthase family protein n=1 Tax=Nocardioides terrisoli TaxID=3388267 RepID=UPI00287BA7C6|nr:cyclopropane-fatty-acyl-phospholipid synthase family protein [Nocardioides marmorisolisilvae]